MGLQGLDLDLYLGAGRGDGNQAVVCIVKQVLVCGINEGSRRSA